MPILDDIMTTFGFNPGDVLKILSENLLESKKYKESLEVWDNEANYKIDQQDRFFLTGMALFYLNQIDNAILTFKKGIEIDPLFKERLYKRGIELIDLEKEESLSFFKMLSSINEYFLEKLSENVEKLLDKKDTNNADKYLDIGLKIYPDSPVMLNNAGYAKILHSENEQSLSFFDKSIELKPDYAIALSNRGLAYLNLAKYEKAEIDIREALILSPDFSIANSNLGFVLIKQGKYLESLSYFDEAFRIEPKNYVAYTNKGLALYFLQRYEEALDCFSQSIEINPNDHVTLSNIGMTYFYMRNYNEAFSYLNTATRISENYDIAWFNKGLVLFRLKQYHEALDSFEQAIRINPNFCNYHIQKIYTLSKLGKDQEALVYASRVTGKYPESALAQTHKGLILHKLGRINDSESEIKQAFKKINTLENNLFSEYAETWFMLGKAYGKIGENNETPVFNERALQCFDNSIKCDPTRIESWYRKGVLLINNCNKFQEGMEELQKYIKNSSNSDEYWSEAYNFIGYAALQKNNLDLAEKAYTKVKDINPRNFGAKIGAELVAQKRNYFEEQKSLLETGKKNLDQLFKDFRNGLNIAQYMYMVQFGLGVIFIIIALFLGLTGKDANMTLLSGISGFVITLLSFVKAAPHDLQKNRVDFSQWMMAYYNWITALYSVNQAKNQMSINQTNTNWQDFQSLQDYFTTLTTNTIQLIEHHCEPDKEYSDNEPQKKTELSPGNSS